LRTISVPAPRGARAVPHLPKRLLVLSGDDRLVEHIRRGNEGAFEVLFERHGPAILSFCRHMLGSREEAEDAVQHTFAAAYRDLVRDERTIKLKPWLYTIARNRCLSVLRARREEAREQPEVATEGLQEQVLRRAELRALLEDLRDLPDDQRAALLLSELGSLSHAEIAAVLDCEVPKVKALVFRARSGLAQRRQARETPCEEIREQLANLRGGSLRRSGLRHHVRSCPDCRSFRDEVRRQRAMVAAILPVAPSLPFKSGVLAAVGLGGGSAGGGAAAGGLGAATLGPFSSATLAKIAIVGALAGGGAVAGTTVLDQRPGPGGEPAAPAIEAPATPAEQNRDAAATPSPAEARRATGRRHDPRRKGSRTRKRARGRATAPRGRAVGHGIRPAGSTSPRRDTAPGAALRATPLRQRGRLQIAPLRRSQSPPAAGEDVLPVDPQLSAGE
jgi:RNA polymerase sigma factor (sigma-70 family)